MFIPIINIIITSQFKDKTINREMVRSFYVNLKLVIWKVAVFLIIFDILINSEATYKLGKEFILFLESHFSITRAQNEVLSLINRSLEMIKISQHTYKG